MQILEGSHTSCLHTCNSGYMTSTKMEGKVRERGQAVLVGCGKGAEGRRLSVAAAGGFVVGPLKSVHFGISEHVPH